MAKGRDIKTLKLFLSLVRAGLWGKEENLQTDNADWEKIARWARQQTVIPIVAKGLEICGIAESSADNSIKEIISSSASNARVHTLLDNTAAKIYKELLEDDVPSVLIKGQGIARYYSNPLLRQCGDVDLLVGSRNYDIIPPALAKLGYVIEKHTDKHIDFYISDVRVELHRTCVESSSAEMNSFFRSWGDEQVELSSKFFSPTASEVMVRMPEDEFNAIFVFFHMFSALIGSGTGLRQLCDMAAVLNSTRHTLDREFILETLTSHKLLHAWQVFGCVLVDMMGLAVEAFPFYDEAHRIKAERIMSLIIESGNFGFFRKRPQGRQTLFKHANFWWRRLMWKTSVIKLFPESLTKF